MSKETDYKTVTTSAGHETADAAVTDIAWLIDQEMEELVEREDVTIIGFSHSLSRDPATLNWVGTGIISFIKVVKAW